MKCVVMKLDTCIAARIGSNILFGNHRASSSVVSIIQAGAPNNHALDIYSRYNISVIISHPPSLKKNEISNILEAAHKRNDNVNCND